MKLILIFLFGNFRFETSQIVTKSQNVDVLGVAAIKRAGAGGRGRDGDQQHRFNQLRDEHSHTQVFVTVVICLLLLFNDIHTNCIGSINSEMSTHTLRFFMTLRSTASVQLIRK